MIDNVLAGKRPPVECDGMQIHDWAVFGKYCRATSMCSKPSDWIAIVKRGSYRE
jgi:hypothetical protein